MNKLINLITDSFSTNDLSFHGVMCIMLLIPTGLLFIVNIGMFVLSPMDLFSFVNLRFIIAVILLWFIWFKTYR